jgi:hypothetical protein
MKKRIDINKALIDGKLIDDAMRDAIKEAVRVHRASGLPLVVWRNNQVTYIDPFTNEIVPPPDYNGNPKPRVARRAAKAKRCAVRNSA